MGVAPPLLAREIAVTVAVTVAIAVAVAVAASALGVAFIDSSNGIHMVQKIVLEDGTDANKPVKKTNARAFEPTSWRQLDPLGKLVRGEGSCMRDPLLWGRGEEVHG
jgi:hypothetical protein